MKKILLVIGFTLLAQPAATFARSAENLPGVSGNGAIQWPSRRTIRASVREQIVTQRPGGIRLAETPLDATFTSSDPALKIQYPSSWQRSDLREYTEPLTLVVMFLSLPKDASGIQQNINLVTEELATEMPLSAYTELGLAIEQDFFRDYSLVRSENTVLAGAYRAHRVIFTANLSGGTMAFEQIWTIRGKTAHVWTFADSAATFETNVKTFERMMDTLVLQ